MSSTTGEINIAQIIRSKRRTISLEVMRDGSLIVRAPILTPRGQIEDLVKKKEGWIKKKQEVVRNRSLEVPSRNFVTGEKYLFLGSAYPLVLVENQAEPLVLMDKFSLVERSQKEGKLIFENWYRERASRILNARVEVHSLQNGFAYTSLRISGARTRWGSCGPKGSLNFSWRLVMAPIEIVDYVVVHELVHLNIRNHSKAYWKEVSKVMPDYRLRKTWLKENGHLLTLE